MFDCTGPLVYLGETVGDGRRKVDRKRETGSDREKMGRGQRLERRMGRCKRKREKRRGGQRKREKRRGGKRKREKRRGG